MLQDPTPRCLEFVLFQTWATLGNINMYNRYPAIDNWGNDTRFRNFDWTQLFIFES